MVVLMVLVHMVPVQFRMGVPASDGTVCNNNKCESDVQLDDGRILHCLRISGGISCDWANAKKP